MKKRKKVSKKAPKLTKASLKKQVLALEKAANAHMRAVFTYAARHPRMLDAVSKPLLKMEKHILDMKKKLGKV